MEIFRNPTLAKVIIFIAFIMFTFASLSPDFMFSMLGSSNMEPFVISLYQGCFGNGTPISWNDQETRKVGIFTMFLLLIIGFILYLLFRKIKTIYNHYKTANKAIKKDN